MKNLTKTIGIAFLISMITSCVSNAPIEIEEKKKNVVVLLYDISASNDEFAVFKPEHLENIYRKIGENGGGDFYGYHIKTFSLKQDAFTAEIPKLNIKELKGNLYQKENIKKINIETAKNFEENIPDFVHSASNRLIVAKNEGFTDIQNALWLASNTLNQ